MTSPPTAAGTADRVLADHAARFAAGAPRPPEDYPEATDAELALDLIVQDRLLRRRRGEHPTAAEYAARFPALAAAIEEQFGVEELFDGADEDPPAPPLPPRFADVQYLGGGGMGDVWLARDTGLDREVAVKVPRDAGADTLARFAAEARALAKVAGDGVCKVFDVAPDHDPPYLVMEYVPGPTLSEVLAADGPLPPARAAALVARAARALRPAHARGFVHRDLKPGNVKVLAGDAVCVLDFGLAVPAAGRPEPLTAPGHAVGTLPYMAPEQLRGGEVGPAADQYALGLILYELLTGRRPFDFATAPPPPSALRRGIPRRLDRACLRALHADPAGRFSSVAELAAGLDRVGGARRLPWVVAAGVVAAALGVAVAAADRPPVGAPAPPAAEVSTPARAPLGAGDLFAAVRADLEALAPGDRQHARYFSLLPLHNDPAVPDAELARTRAAVAVVINTLHTSTRIAAPRPVGPGGVALAIDLRDLGWSAAGQWHHLGVRSPYGIRHDSPDVRRAEADVFELAGSRLPVLRADWFVAAAASGPVPARALGLPATLAELDAAPVAAGGAVWRSSGPDGTRLLLELPTGFHAFAAATPDGRLADLPAGPACPGDRTATCVECHAAGPRGGTAARGRDALAATVARYWAPAPGDARDPVGPVVRRYDRPVGAAAAARELGVADPELVRAAVARDERLREMGLGPLAAGGEVPRAVWAAGEIDRSPFRALAAALGVGRPVRAP